MPWFLELRFEKFGCGTDSRLHRFPSLVGIRIRLDSAAIMMLNVATEHPTHWKKFSDLRLRMKTFCFQVFPHMSGDSVKVSTLANPVNCKTNLLNEIQSGVLQPAVPSMVLNAHMESNGSQTSLQVSWDQAPGDMDSYLVQLLSSDSAVQEQTLFPNTTRAQFDQLTPGSSYQALIYTRSGDLSNQVNVTATTGM